MTDPAKTRGERPTADAWWAGRNAEKDTLRDEIWAGLETAEIGVGPVRSRIPNFIGADLAAWHLARLPAWRAAKVVKCNPDPPQIPVRLRALHENKILYVMAMATVDVARNEFGLQVPRDLSVVGYDNVAASLAERRRVQTIESIGRQPDDLVSAFRLLNGLSSHDFSAMRGLIGKPQRVISATQKRGGRYIAALFDYGGFVATFETGVDRVGRFDASIEVFTGSERVRIDYDTPYIRHFPTRLSIYGTDGERLSYRQELPSFRDPYSREWEALLACIGTGKPVSTPLEDAAEDIQLAIDVVQAIVETPRIR